MNASVFLLVHESPMRMHGGEKVVTSYEIFLNDVRLRGYSTHGSMEEGYWGNAAHSFALNYAQMVAATLSVQVVKIRKRDKFAKIPFNHSTAV